MYYGDLNIYLYLTMIKRSSKYQKGPMNPQKKGRESYFKGYVEKEKGEARP